MIKQVPEGESFALVAGRLARDGVGLEVNAYCRRANAKAVELAGPDGEVVVFTMGPPAAADALREMIACGATRGIHICDQRLAGSDTLVTSRVLAAAIYAEGPFDLVLCGLNSIDADTGQVPPQIAELLGLPFVAGARALTASSDDELKVVTETDTVNQSLRVTLPAVVSTAERLCDPSKADAARRASVRGDLIVQRNIRDLGFRAVDVGLLGSPTRVGEPSVVELVRGRHRAVSVADAVDLLSELGVFEHAPRLEAESVPVSPLGPTQIWAVLDRPEVGHELLSRAAEIAVVVGGTVTAVVTEDPTADLGPSGADRVLVVPGVHADHRGELLATAAGVDRPRIVLVDGTIAGRAIASKIAARHRWGLTGDGIRVDVGDDGELIVWKPALGGRMIAPITSTSSTQVATIRPGALDGRSPRRAASAPVVFWPDEHLCSVRIQVDASAPVDPGSAELAGAAAVIGIGQGVAPDRYGLLRPLARALGATMGATRKVTDHGWMPRSRQIGITGASISPRLYVSVGASGRYNHACGFAAADVVLAINSDPSADIFDLADVGLVGDWSEIVASLHQEISDRSLDVGISS